MIEIAGRLVVPVAGTPVSLYALLNASAFPFKTYQSVLLQADLGNTGRVYIGKSTMNKTTRAGCAAVLVVPTTVAIPSFGISNPLAPAGVDISALYLDVDVSGDGVLATFLVT